MTKEEKVTSLEQLGFITSSQVDEFQQYQSKKIFSLNTELLFLMYLSVILFTSGVGILIYENIDTIGHTVILGLIFIVTVLCFYFSFKKAKGFSKQQVLFESPVYDYLVLTGSMLACIFVGYLQYQYQILGTNYQGVSLISAIICFAVAYYFDQKTVLSMAITSLTAFIGITISPSNFFDIEVFEHPQLIYFGLILSVILLVWVYFSEKQQLKKHFSFVYYTFAQHLSGLCIIAGLVEDYWLLFVFFSIGINYFFYQLSYRIKEISLFIFTLLYAYVGVNICIGRLLSHIDIGEFFALIAMIIPFYFILSIVMFIKAIRNFKKEKDASI
ncbi:MAG: DUF2157 domain-containing protein [Limnohabitans sp.]|nr:DUF2157 domain-containing protein [Limnohabitans sp.]